MNKKPSRLSENVSPFRAKYADFVSDLVLIKLNLVPKVIICFAAQLNIFLIVYHADSRVAPICFKCSFTFSTVHPNVSAAHKFLAPSSSM